MVTPNRKCASCFLPSFCLPLFVCRDYLKAMKEVVVPVTMTSIVNAAMFAVLVCPSCILPEPMSKPLFSSEFERHTGSFCLCSGGVVRGDRFVLYHHTLFPCLLLFGYAAPSKRAARLSCVRLHLGARRRTAERETRFSFCLPVRQLVPADHSWGICDA